WCNKGGSNSQVQSESLDHITTHNPHHVFENHTITKINDVPVGDTLTPIDSYSPSDAATAFTHYEDRDCEIVPAADTTTIRTTMARYNYVEFILEINSDQKQVADGRMLMARVYDLGGDLLVHNRRMVFANGTPPE